MNIDQGRFTKEQLRGMAQKYELDVTKPTKEVIFLVNGKPAICPFKHSDHVDGICSSRCPMFTLTSVPLDPMLKKPELRMIAYSCAMAERSEHMIESVFFMNDPFEDRGGKNA